MIAAIRLPWRARVNGSVFGVGAVDDRGQLGAGLGHAQVINDGHVQNVHSHFSFLYKHVVVSGAAAVRTEFGVAGWGVGGHGAMFGTHSDHRRPLLAQRPAYLNDYELSRWAPMSADQHLSSVARNATRPPTFRRCADLSRMVAHMEADDLIEHFVSTRPVADRTRRAYKGDLRRFLGWCTREGLSFQNVSARDLARLQDVRRRSGAADSSINRQLHTVGQFFRWLVGEGIVATSPATNIVRFKTSFAVRDTLSVHELSELWDACSDAKDAAVIGLLGINALRVDEVSTADISDLSKMDGLPVLNIHSRITSHVRPFTVLAAEVHDAIRSSIGDRRTGPLLLNREGERLERRAIARIVARVSKRAGITFPVTPITLSFTMRAIAIERGFSYVSVVRAAGEFEGRRLTRWLAVAPNPVSDHAALRLARLVIGHGSSTLDMLSHARVVLHETDAPPAASVMLAGAALEQHLRLLTRENHVPMSKDERKAQIGTYVALLTGHEVISKSDNQLATSIAQHRDNAAHGWFNDVSEPDAEWVIRSTEELVNRYPLSSRQ
jgi:site-specific recombinase XerD